MPSNRRRRRCGVGREPRLSSVGPALLLVSCAVAMAQDLGAPPGAGAPGSMQGADFLLSLGPYGALVWGAYLLGKGVRVTIQVELSDHDREMIERLGRASSAIGQ